MTQTRLKDMDEKKANCGCWPLKMCQGNNQKKPIEPMSAWIILAATFMALLIASVPENTTGIFYDYFTDKYDTNRAVIGWVVSLFYASICVSGKFVIVLISNNYIHAK